MTRLVLGSIAVALVCACGPRSVDPPRGRWNVLLVTLDTLRADHLGCYGNPDAVTPALDGLAARGALFEHAYTSAPMTLPAHATILTGLQPPEHGVHTNGVETLASDVPTMATRLAAEGYRTGAFLAAFVLHRKFGLARGFETYDDDLTAALPQEVPEPLSVYRPGNTVVDAALGWLDGVVAGGVPFFAWVHLYDAHYPYLEHPELAGTRFAGLASYPSQVAFVDLQVARLLRFLDERQLRAHTLVVVVGDHGEGLGEHGEMEHGYLLNEEVLRVPFLVVTPAGTPQRVRPVVATIDVLPTVLDLLGLAPQPGVSGRSLLPALAGRRIDSRAAYAETDLPFRSFGWSPMQSLTADRWKYVRSPRPELFDRSLDPIEDDNLARERPDDLARLEAELRGTEQQMQRRSAEAVRLGAAERQRLEALGYVADGGASPAGSPALRDVKDMLPTKHLQVQLSRGMAFGTLTPEKAVKVARELVRRSPESPGFHKTLGTLLLRAGKLEEARTELETAVRLRPELADAQATLGNLAHRQGRLDDAITHFTAALQADPSLADASFDLANLLSARGRLEEAVRAYEGVLQNDAAHVDAHYNLGNTLARLGQTDTAIAHYRAALRLRPDFGLAHQNLARVLASAGDAAGAEEHYREAIRLMPDLAPAHVQLSRILASSGRTKEAIDHAAVALQLTPDEPEVAAQLAWLLASTASGPIAALRAVALAERADVATHGADPRILDVLAASYAAAGRYRDALLIGHHALAGARAAGDAPLVAAIEERLALYGQRQPYRQR